MTTQDAMVWPPSRAAGGAQKSPGDAEARLRSMILAISDRQAPRNRDYNIRLAVRARSLSLALRNC